MRKVWKPKTIKLHNVSYVNKSPDHSSGLLLIHFKVFWVLKIMNVGLLTSEI